MPEYKLGVSTTFDCGCSWSWKTYRFTDTCEWHEGRPDDCCCLTTGEDDGAKTCWPHHDCRNSDCTHQDNDDEFEERIYDGD